MTFDDWQVTVPAGIREDALWRMEVYRQALFVADLSWHDSARLAEQKRFGLADQLHRATGSVSANIAEGHSRSSMKDQCRFYEYANGSARESRDWYFKSRHALGESVVSHRIELLTSVIRQLTAIVRRTK
ncbi:MAG: four helix bundle protein [Planctomycetota bacterium]